ncbi:sterol desaturase family protein [Yersinia similis]|uniref:sterol desaturase family protein n=1 Tax=Yersinia similis TaxID=367190 RepID=UPI0011A2DBCA|nr:sterol desaturase family protein [Yersinia similis]
MSELIIPVILMVVFVVGEAWLLKLKDGYYVDWHDVVFNINSGHIMLWLFRGLEIVCYTAVLNHFSLSLFTDVSPFWVWCFALFAWDFGFYWLHRLHHQLRLLWAVHVVHHQGEHYNLSLGVRNSWYSSLTSIPFFIVLAWLGVPLTVFLGVSILHYSIQFFNHSAMTPKLGFLEKIFVTPFHHRIHHINDMAYANSNYGGSFIFWDKLFGTFCAAPPAQLYHYGVKGKRPSHNPFVASNLPFARYLKLPSMTQEAGRSFDVSPWVVFSGAMLLFALVLGYIQWYGYGYQNVTASQITLFILLALGTITLGGISEGQRWGIVGWFSLTLLLPLIFILWFGWSHGFWLITILMLTLHGSCVLCGWGRRKVAVNKTETKKTEVKKTDVEPPHA